MSSTVHAPPHEKWRILTQQIIKIGAPDTGNKYMKDEVTMERRG
jgi:hypothetical protein